MNHNETVKKNNHIKVHDFSTNIIFKAIDHFQYLSLLTAGLW